MDKGPWYTVGVWVASKDFTHDVMLEIRGDFEDAKQRIAYAEWLAGVLNRVCADQPRCFRCGHAAHAGDCVNVAPDQPNHQWREAHGPIKWPHCSVCGVIQRSDGRNGPCKGPASVTTRTDQPTGSEQ